MISIYRLFTHDKYLDIFFFSCVRVRASNEVKQMRGNWKMRSEKICRVLFNGRKKNKHFSQLKQKRS